MSDKELIKQEIERQIEKGKVKCQESQENNDYESFVAWSEHVATCGKLLVFINSLPEEPASDDLDKLVISLEETIGTSPHSREVIKEYLQRTAEWGRNHFEDKSEMVSEDLEEAANQHSKQVFHGLLVEDNITAFKAGAKWQKQRMMKEAVELHIVESFNPVGTENEKPHGFTALCYNAKYPDFYPVTGQTVKVIPFKEVYNNEQDCRN